LDSQFFNELYAFDMERKKWYVLDYQTKREAVTRRRRGKVSTAADGGGSSSSEDEEETLETGLNKFEWIFEYVNENGKMCSMVVPADEEETAAVPEPVPVLIDNKLEPEPAIVPEQVQTPEVKPRVIAQHSFELPPERISACLLIRNNQLLLYGGMVELGLKEVTFDDCWTLDLKVRDKWVKRVNGTMHMQKWLGDEESEVDSEFEKVDSSVFDSSSDSSSSDSESSSSGSEEPEAPKRTGKVTMKEKMALFQKKHDIADDTRTPLLNESLKEFFARTQQHWVQEGQKQLKPDDDPKELRRLAFSLAQERFESLKQVLDKLKGMEEEQSLNEKDFKKSKR
jgi:hypothetical protein